jgi:hypothetical protein
MYGRLHEFLEAFSPPRPRIGLHRRRLVKQSAVWSERIDIWK